MSSSLFSSSWYRVAGLTPRLRPHTQIHRHRYRGQLWYLIQDHISGRFHRFTPQTYTVIGMMDGHRTLDQIWQSACERLGDEMPSQDEVIQLLGQLHRADTIQADIPPDMAELDKRRRTAIRAKILAQIKSPLSIRIPLWDPEDFLERTQKVSQVVFGPAGALLWIIVIVTAFLLAGTHWDSLTSNLADRVLALENLLLLWLVYPVVKAIHEFGHGYAVKRWGGEVHEMGIMLLIFMPVPYVEASAASAFSNKYQRMLVGAAGILVELFLAALAMVVWVLVEPGAVRAVAFDVMLVAGISTVLFNGNPLLRFDAYYVLSDYLEIPNLGSRANRQLGALIKRYALGIKKQDQPPSQTTGEATWLVIYSLTSFCYRMIIMLGIAFFVASKAFALGIILALWSVYNFLVQPILKMVKVTWADEQIKQRRIRLLFLSSGFIGLLVVLLFWLPAPKMTITEGILWVPEKARIVAMAQGVVEEVLVMPGERVESGAPLIRCRNIDLDSKIEVMRGRLKELAARNRIAQSLTRTTESRLIEEEIEHSRSELIWLLEERRSLLIRSPFAGVFHLASGDELSGRFVQRGESLGYLLRPGEYHGRVVVRQADVDSVRSDVQSVSVRFAEDIDTVIKASMYREVPGAHRELPSMALSLEGGGTFALDPGEIQTPKAYEPFFQFDILLGGAPLNRIGERLYVRFVHTPEPLGFRWMRAARRALLEQLDI